MAGVMWEVASFAVGRIPDSWALGEGSDSPAMDRRLMPWESQPLAKVTTRGL